MTITRLLILLSLSSFLMACGSDNNAAPSRPPPKITAFENWVKESPRSYETITQLSSIAENAEKTGVIPSFFTNAALMRREDRDNVQNGYTYPLYFASKTREFPAGHWNGGYTIKKGAPSDQAEAKKVDDIRTEMTEFWGEDGYKTLFYGLNNYALIDVRYYSFKPKPPMVGETCFTVRWVASRDGTFNYCFNGHRFFQNEDSSFPKVRWNKNVSGNGDGDAVEAYKLFVLSLASYEVIFDNPDNRMLRDIFITNERLSVQMHKANQAFDGAFQYYVDEQRYLDGRQ